MRPHRNRGLFSNYYLDELLPKDDEFKIPISEVKTVFEKVKGIWDRGRFEAINEDQLRKHFLDKVLDYLGWVVDVNAPVPTGEWSKRPDYALFQSAEYLKTAQKGKKEDYFKKVACIAEGKRLGRHLDKRLKTESDPFEVQIPSMQISKYLWLTGVKWGILTDGKYWRLYERETSKRLDIFYEVDLEGLIESGSPEGFRYFYLLFRKEAFPEFIEKVYTGSVDYAEEVGEQLKENIYQALKTLAQGLIKTSGNNLTEAHLKEIHDNSLILLYRLLFILYAEHRDLLPLGVNRLYTESYSLDAFKKEVANRLDKNEPIAASTFGYWNKLKELFEIINKGNRELGVPPYNGGLFDPEKHNFLEKYRIGDLYVAKAIDLLSRSKDKAYIDYGSLEIRHLGSIYEGLLEYKLKIADQNLVPIKDKGKEVFVSLDEAKKQKKTIREDEKIHSGEIYLVTDKGERKATGSYYTPDYIVKYIVENTLGPLVEEKQKKVSKNIEELKGKIKGARGASREFHEKELRKAEGGLIDEILLLKVLDPAMGSGHFLVEATDFLARELLKVLSGEPLEEHSKEMVIREPTEHYRLREPEEEDIRWARREVVERCIFGVDLNPMAVELAKLSLWLYTVAKNRPLNFLDHHLRCGNSLIGAGIDDLASLPEFKKKKAEGGPVQLGLFESIFKGKVYILLGAFAQIEMLPSDTVEQIREKEGLYQNFRKIVSRFQDVADVWASAYFGNDVNSGNYQKLQNRLRSTDEEWERLSQEEWFKRAKEIVKEKRFFHWELEFPEIFFEGHQRKENPGFDAVVGNPPYVRIQELNATSPAEVKYFSIFTSAIGSYDLYILFVEQSLKLLRERGQFGYILPNKFIHLDYGQGLRGVISSQKALLRIIDFGDNQIFPDQTTYTCLLFLRRPTDNFEYFKLPRVGDQDEINNLLSSKNGIPFIKESEEKLGEDPWLLLDEKEKCITKKLDSISQQLGDIVEKIIVGLQTSADNIYILRRLGEREGLIRAYSSSLKREVLFEPGVMKPLVSGEDIDRYAYPETEKLLIFPYVLEEKGAKLLEPEEFGQKYPRTWEYLKLHEKELRGREKGKMDNDQWYAFGRTQNLDKHERAKLGVARLADRLRLISDLEHRLYFDNVDVNGILLRMELNWTGSYILSLLNSKLIDWRFKIGSVPFRGNFFSANKQFISPLPVRRIFFVTPKKPREALLKEAKDIFEKFLNTGNGQGMLSFVQARLLKKYQPDPELVRKYNADPFNKDWHIPEVPLWEQSDVVHNVLAFLAEQMIEMNKEKQREIKGYLKWLEGQLKIQSDNDGNTGIEALTGKTQIKNYLGDYQKNEEHLPFEEFWKILEKNKTRIQTNLKSRELYESIRSEYEKSLSKLLPLKENLRKTDWLIDQIVYKLYGLTEAEIKIVEGRGAMGS